LLIGETRIDSTHANKLVATNIICIGLLSAFSLPLFRNFMKREPSGRAVVTSIDWRAIGRNSRFNVACGLKPRRRGKERWTISEKYLQNETTHASALEKAPCLRGDNRWLDNKKEEKSGKIVASQRF
jgi:hypothetical protein